MSIREEQEKRKSNKSGGFGLAAAAIGVGVGAALYYIFTKRNEHPDTEGATSSNWSCEEPQSLNNGDHVSNIRDERFRARSWSLEECSICCDIMLKDQAITSLPCTHQFHEACIQPWLSMNEQQTCPNCRKTAA